MEKQIIERLSITCIVPARSWNYLYANTDKRDIFIYGHRSRVEFFAKNEAVNISNFQDTVTKLSAIKYFNEKSENCIGKLAQIDFNNEIDVLIKFGTCLISYDLMENFKADIWVNNKETTIEFHLYNAEEYRNIRVEDVLLPDPNEDERLVQIEISIKNLKKTYNDNLVSLIQKQPIFFKKLFSFGFNFTQNQLEELKNVLVWDEVSANSQIQWTELLIKTFSDKINWVIFIQNQSIFWNESNIELFLDKIDWNSLSSSNAIRWSHPLIEKYSNKISWINLSRNEAIPWTKEFIIKNKSKFKLDVLFANKAVPWDIELIELFKNETKNWNFISSNIGKFWSEEIIEKYINEFNWNYLDNPSIPLTISLAEKYPNQIRWMNASKNPNPKWTKEIIEKYKDKLAFGWLSGNPSLPWCKQFIEKYINDWNWSNISSNIGIPWTESLIEKYEDKLYFDLLSENPCLPWSLPLLEKYRNKWNWCKIGSNTGISFPDEFWIKNKEILFPKNKEGGLWSSVNDTSNNCNIPINIDLVFELKDNLDWNVFYRNVKRTGKYEILLKEFSYELFKNLIQIGIL